jgi:hypothetical protein
MAMVKPEAIKWMTESQLEAVIDWLGTTYDEDINGQASEDLQIGVDIVLEALGREGHEAT